MAARTFVPTDYPLVDLETGKITAQWRRFQQDVSTALTPGAINTLLTSDGVGFVWSKLKNANVDVAAAIAYSKLNLATSIVNGDIAAAAAIDWTKISKVGSSIADLATRSAGDLNSGTLPDARFMSTTSFAPTATGFTEVGTPTYAGKYARHGSLVVFEITITSTTSVASTANTSSLTLPVTPAFGSTCTAVNASTTTSYGVGLVYTDGKVWTPTWAANANTVVAGWYFA